MAEKLMLIDGHSILNRAFYGVPDLSNSEGVPTNALYGFLNIMFRFIDEENPDYIMVAFDMDAPTFRHKAYSAYKGTRNPMPDALRKQVPLMKELLTAMNITIVQKEGFEADDILGTLAKSSAKRGMEVSVISGDRDLLQLAAPSVKIRIPKTKKGITEVEDYYPEDVKALYGVTPSEFIDMKALMGDSSDNIPGAPGVGPKTASAIIMQYHHLENVFENLDALKPPKAKKSISENIEQIKLSRFLSEIKTDVALDYDMGKSRAKDFFNEESYKLFKRYGFKSMLKHFESQADTALKCYDAFRTVQELDEVEKIFERAVQIAHHGEYIGIFLVADESLMAVSFALSDKEVYYIPVFGFVTEEYLRNKLIDLTKVCSKRNLVIANLKDYLGIFEGDNPISEKSFFDIAVASYLIHPSNEKYDYESLSKEYLDMIVPSFAELIGKKSVRELFDFGDVNLFKLSCLTAFVHYKCAVLVREQLQKENMYQLFEEIEMPLVVVLYDMQKYGIRVDKQSLADYSKVLGDKIDVLEGEIYEAAGERFNINSPKQLGVILFEKMQMPYAKKTKSGYSTAADVLEKLAPDYPIVEKILSYRQLTKLKSTYADGLAVYIREDGRIHGTFNQTITATGRISSTEPNLQNIPIRMEIGKAIRKVFIPEEDYVFLDADYSQIELRILAHMSGDEKLIKAYNGSVDIHRATAAEVFNVPLEEVTPLQRRNAKAVNFGIIYGMSSFGLSQDLSISKNDAKEYIERYFNSYPKIKGFIDGLVESAREKGYSLTMYHRRREIPELSSGNFMQRSFGERVAMNAPIQGTAADIIKLAMIRVSRALKERKLKSRLILQIHDELLVEAHKDEIDIVKSIIDEGMRNAAHLSVPLEIDLKQGNDWLEAH